MDANFLSNFIRKNLLFLFYTRIFTKHLFQFIYSTHLFNKIFIILQFFIIHFLTAPLSHRPTVHHYQWSIHTQPPSPPSSPPNQHRQEKPTYSIRNSFNLKPINHPPNPKPSQVKSSPTQSVAVSSKPTNELEKTSWSRSKPTNPHPQSTKKPGKKKKKK